MTISVLPRPILRTPIAAKMPVLKVIGLGGGGCNAINRMIELGIGGVDFIAANTDCQALNATLAPVKIHLGPKSTRGLGAGGNPQMGEAAAEESYSALNEALSGADMIFLTAGMGGGTGTGSIPVAARVARATGAVVVAIVTTPFSFEVGRRQSNAREGLIEITAICRYPYHRSKRPPASDRFPRPLAWKWRSALRMMSFARESRASQS